MPTACSMHGGNQKCIQDSGRKTSRRVWKDSAKMNTKRRDWWCGLDPRG
jgi:hypothetical protein